LQLLKEKGHPIIQQLLRNFTGAQATDGASMVVSFAAGHARDLPLFLSWLPIFSRAYYDRRPFEETTLEPPLGSGPYKVGRFEPGRYIEYERVKDWWGSDLPVARGQNNFDVIRYEYYRDRDIAFEGLSSRSYLFREELVSSGRAATTFRRSARDASNATSSPIIPHPRHRAGTSICDGRNSRPSRCARPLSMYLILNGSTRR
jgi:ABC-type oligopeptide transport system substrate-binding subunit